MDDSSPATGIDHPAATLDFEVTESLVRELLVAQRPDLAHLSLRRVEPGWDNAVFRLGEDLAARLPHRISGAFLIEHERRWLAGLLDGIPDAAHGGLDSCAPIRDGRAGCGYPWSWSILRWHAGEVASSCPPDDLGDAAERLGIFVAALHRPAPDDAPDNPFRGGPIRERRNLLGEHLDRVEAFERPFGAAMDRADVEDGFERAVALGGDVGEPVWLHGDLHPGNLIVRDGELSAVIDFGDLTAGDRAVDLSIAWSMFANASDVRDRFREAAGAIRLVDDATWSRARAWAIVLNVAYLQGALVTPERLQIARDGLRAAIGG